MGQHIVVIGAGGAIGSAFTKLLSEHAEIDVISAVSRSGTLAALPKVTPYHCDITSEDSIRALAQNLEGKDIDGVIVASGILHDSARDIFPEKALKDIELDQLKSVFEINIFGPALLAKYLCPLLPRDRESFFVALSARVGSISDNHLGGWYAYRASKAALNMILKTAAIEMKRTHKKCVVAGLHPGTVESALSEPFQANVKPEKLFTPDDAAQKLWKVILSLDPKSSGQCFAWDGKIIQP